MAHLSTLACCDRAVFARGLWTLVNVFDHLWVERFPEVHRHFDVHVAISDLHGRNENDVSLEIVDLQSEFDGSDATLFEETLRVELWPVPKTERLRFEVPHLEIRRPGAIELRVSLDGHLIGIGTLVARESEA